MEPAKKCRADVQLYIDELPLYSGSFNQPRQALDGIMLKKSREFLVGVYCEMQTPGDVSKHLQDVIGKRNTPSRENLLLGFPGVKYNRGFLLESLLNRYEREWMIGLLKNRTVIRQGTLFGRAKFIFIKETQGPKVFCLLRSMFCIRMDGRNCPGSTRPVL